VVFDSLLSSNEAVKSCRIDLEKEERSFIIGFYERKENV
jgi:hypothetical protein